MGLFKEHQQSSIERISSIFGKPVHEMSVEEILQNASQLFLMSESEYHQRIKDSGIGMNEDPAKSALHYHTDGIALLRILSETHKISVGKKDLVDLVLKTNFGLGYFEAILKEVFRDYAESLEEGDLGELRTIFQQYYNQEKANLIRHNQFDQELKTQHRIPQPTLLEDRIISTDVIPFAISFNADNQLVVLGQRYKGESEAGTLLALQIYDINTKSKISSVNTEIGVYFCGPIPWANSFQGNLSIGSNGIIYAGGDNHIQRFNGNLEPLHDNEGRFLDALKLLKDKGIFSSWADYLPVPFRTFQVAESDGVHYFIVRPDVSPKHSANILVASDGKQIVGEPLLFSPSGGLSGGGSDDTARVVIHGNDLYLKYNHDILAVDRSLTPEAYKRAFKIVDKEELDLGFIPSNHCVDSTGLLWAVTKLPDEVVSSIKAYARGSKRGEMLTHLYPLNHPGGWPLFRSMAISKEGILAYTDVQKSQIYLYQIRNK